MGKRIIQQARGHGSSTYRVRRKAYSHKLGFPRTLNGKGEVVNLIDSAGHTAPLAKIKWDHGIFFVPAFKGMFVGQEIDFDSKEIKDGNIIELKELPIKTKIFCIESRPGDGGKFMKAGGTNAVLNRVIDGKIYVSMPSKKEKIFNGKCRAMVGEIAGSGRLDKPVIKAGRRYHLMRARGKLWPRTSAIKMNAIDHPFGGGRGKHPKSKIAKRNSAPGQKVGLLSPRRTGKKK